MDINLEEITESDILPILDAASVSYKLDSDNDIRLESESPFYLKVDKSHDAIRFFGWVKTNEKNEIELKNALNLMNTGSSTIKYSSLGGDEVFFEYGIILSGKIDRTHLLKTIEHIKDKTSILSLVLAQLVKKSKKTD